MVGLWSKRPLDDSLDAVILAAGKGTGMRSGLPKVLHPLADLLAAGSEHALREGGARSAAPAASIRSRTGT